MLKIFISYRRDDSAYVTGMLAEKLREGFGKTSVFIDIDTIPFGVDIRDHISRAVGECAVLLAVIGDAWVDAATADGRRRLDTPTDFVRLEIESALKRGIPVVPVLVDNAQMPAETDLPESLRSLAYRNAAELRPGRDLQHHINILTRGIQSMFESSAGSVGLTEEPQPPADHAQPAVHGQPLGSVGPSLEREDRRKPSLMGLAILFAIALTTGIAFISTAISLGSGSTADFFGYGSFVFFSGAGLIAIVFALRFRHRLTRR